MPVFSRRKTYQKLFQVYTTLCMYFFYGQLCNPAPGRPVFSLHQNAVRPVCLPVGPRSERGRTLRHCILSVQNGHHPTSQQSQRLNNYNYIHVLFIYSLGRKIYRLQSQFCVRRVVQNVSSQKNFIRHYNNIIILHHSLCSSMKTNSDI